MKTNTKDIVVYYQKVKNGTINSLIVTCDKLFSSNEDIDKAILAATGGVYRAWW